MHIESQVSKLLNGEHPAVFYAGLLQSGKVEEIVTWREVYAIWNGVFKENNVNLVDLFQKIPVIDFPVDKPSLLRWWKTSKVSQSKELSDKGFYETYDIQDVDGKTLYSGFKEAMFAMASLKMNQEKLAAFLLNCSSFARLGNANIYPKNNWLPVEGAEVLNTLLVRTLRGLKVNPSPWPSNSRGILPCHREDKNSSVRTLRELIKYYAEEHVLLIREYRIVLLANPAKL